MNLFEQMMRENKKASKACLREARGPRGGNASTIVIKIPSGRGQFAEYDQLRLATETIAESTKELAEILANLRTSAESPVRKAEDIQSKLKSITDALNLAKQALPEESTD